MDVLIVENKGPLGQLWADHLRRHGGRVKLVATSDDAIMAISDQDFEVIVVNLEQAHDAISVSDFAQYRQPDTQVMFVTDTSFFSDGSIFTLASNACTLVPSTTPPEDIAAMVEHYAVHH